MSLFEPIRVGATVRVWSDSSLGQPQRQTEQGDSSIVVYAWPPDDAQDEVWLYFVRDTLRVVKWAFYFD
jgi:hypothetical protein